MHKSTDHPTPTPQETSRTITLNGRAFHYHDHGAGAPVVLIHGGGPGATGWSNYARNIGILGGTFRLLTVDLPGFGASQAMPLVDGVFTTYARVIAQFLDHIHVDRVHFIGNSLGGGTALKFALLFPDRAQRLVMMGAAGGKTMTSPFPTEGMKHLFGYARGAGPSLDKMRNFLNSMVYDSSELTDDILRQRYEGSINPSVRDNWPFGQDPLPPLEQLWREDLSRLEHEILLIWGREDRTIPLDMGLNYMAQLPNAQMHIYNKCGHWVQWEKAKAFNALVTEFLTA